MKISRVSAAELAIMEYIWDQGGGATAKGIRDHLNSGRQNDLLTPQAVRSYLLKLLHKKMIIKTKDGDRDYLYCPAISREEYEAQSAREVLDTMYKGSLLNFVSALSGRELITKEEADEVRKMLEDYGKD